MGPAGEEGGLGASAGPVTAATLVSRILGVVREQVVAALFGAGNAADAFNIAFRIPNLLRDL
ncbi:MAG TPA: lipid II flippase MurJ, partial [Candidatus Eisenbacteria bacterium]|nr:lipid II flippase MurJ [Candidatus Eisenbacteria bacterium]